MGIDNSSGWICPVCKEVNSPSQSTCANPDCPSKKQKQEAAELSDNKTLLQE